MHGYPAMQLLREISKKAAGLSDNSWTLIHALYRSVGLQTVKELVPDQKKQSS